MLFGNIVGKEKEALIILLYRGLMVDIILIDFGCQLKHIDGVATSIEIIDIKIQWS